MKKLNKPELEIINLEEDIIVTSPGSLLGSSGANDEGSVSPEEESPTQG